MTNALNLFLEPDLRLALEMLVYRENVNSQSFLVLAASLPNNPFVF